MRNLSQNSARAATCTTVFLSYLALNATPEFAPTVLLLPAVAIALMPSAERLDKKFGVYRRITSGVALAYAASLYFIFRAAGLLDGVIFLVMFIQLYSLMHEKHGRNYDHIILMSFFLVLAASVLSPSPVIGIVFFGFALSAVWMLAAMEMTSSMRRSGASTVTEHAEYGRNGESMAVRTSRGARFQTLGWAAMCGVFVVFAAILLFFVTPRMEAGLLGSENATPYEAGLNPRILDLSAGGTLLLDTTAVMRVTFPDEEGGVLNGEKYWRSSSMNQYTDGGWARWDIMTAASRALDSTDPYHWFTSLQGRNQEPGMFRLEFHPGNRIVRQEIFMDRPPQTGVPVLAIVRGVQPMPGAKDVRYRWDSAGDFSVEVAMRRPDALQYEAWSEMPMRDPEVLRAFAGDFAGPMNPRDMFTFTYNNLSDETIALVRSLTEDKETYYDKIAALETYLSSDNYLYTLRIPELSKDHPVDDFILNVKRGHCELYASALALMVRSLEIPARLANGYRGGTFDPSDRAYTVTQDMAHVWVEVYFPNYGWVIFDPSPKSDELDDRAISVFQRAMSRIVLKGKLIWYRGVVGFNPNNRFAVIKDATIGFFRGPSETQGASRSFTATGSGGRLVFIGLAASGIVATFVFVVRRAGARPGRKRIPITLTREQQQASTLRKQLLNRLKHAGVVGGNMTVDELRAAIIQFPEEDRRPARQVLEAYNAVRFGRRPLTTGAYSTLRRMVRGLRQAMAQSPAQE